MLLYTSLIENDVRGKHYLKMSTKVARGGGGNNSFGEERVPQLADGWSFHDHRESTRVFCS